MNPLNKIRLSHYSDHEGVYSGVKTEVNGVEMQQVSDIRLECSVEGPPVLKLTQFVDSPLDVTLNGHVDPICLIADNDYTLVVDHPTPDTTRYRAVKKV